MDEEHPLQRRKVAENINFIADRLPRETGARLVGSAARNHLAEVRAQLEALRRQNHPKNPNATIEQTLRDLNS